MKYIVTTTINSPTEAILKFCEKAGWCFIIVGDLKTPHEEYQKLEKEYIGEKIKYLTPQYQEENYKELSDSIGWNTISRRNIGIVEAYNYGASIIAIVDDDNIPYDNWGKYENLYIDKEIIVDLYEPKTDVFDPLSVTNHNYLWHRGFPIEYVKDKNMLKYKGKIKRKVLIQADLWDGDPDIDAFARIIYDPIVKFNIIQPYCSNKISPFNTQNTFLSREVIPYYILFPFIGRMDDIWASYMIETKFPNSLIYNSSSVYQRRERKDYMNDFEKELLGYRKSLDFIDKLSNIEKYFKEFLPEEAINFYNIYIKQFNNTHNEKN